MVGVSWENVFCFPGFKGKYCVIPWENKVPVCEDSCFVSQWGVPMISANRWKRAQAAEQDSWKGNENDNDRANEHLDGFDKYTKMPNDLKNLLEVGCGPWTQSSFMLKQRDTFQLNTITLWEPSLLFYVQNTPTCAYKTGQLRNYSTILVNAPGEYLLLREQYDTVVMINVLEHVQNALQILENLYNSLKPGGILVLSDRWWDNYNFYGQLINDEFLGKDRMYHPIRMKKGIFDHFMSLFDPIFENWVAQAFVSRGATGIYFIGTKK